MKHAEALAMFSTALDHYRDAVQLRMELVQAGGTAGQQAHAEGVEAMARDEVVQAFNVVAALVFPEAAQAARCKKCDAHLMFSARARGNRMCGPCTRGEAP